ncbi:MAG: hypothetical protein PHD64_11510 [Mesotoga sp.]|nr:hypothetical protein [Mesotoga sp.]
MTPEEAEKLVVELETQKKCNLLLNHAGQQQDIVIHLLKGKLAEERALRICHATGDPVGHWSHYEPMLLDVAREQLKAEMPGVEWE